jgi:transcription elongation factor GreA
MTRDFQAVLTRWPMVTANTKVYLTPKGASELRQELDHLINVERRALAERLHQVLGEGDPSENVEYETMRADGAFLEGRIRQLEAMLCDPIVFEENQGPKDEVGLGSRVTVMAPPLPPCWPTP